MHNYTIVSLKPNHLTGGSLGRYPVSDILWWLAENNITYDIGFKELWFANEDDAVFFKTVWG